MKEPKSDGGWLSPAWIFAICAAIVAVPVIVQVVVPMVAHWYGCQQLAPIERLFTRGC
jgi:hypothetical protein